MAGNLKLDATREQDLAITVSPSNTFAMGSDEEHVAITGTGLVCGNLYRSTVLYLSLTATTWKGESVIQNSHLCIQIVLLGVLYMYPSISPRLRGLVCFQYLASPSLPKRAEGIVQW